MNTTTEFQKCLHCDRRAQSRGCCPTCYSRIYSQIRDGQFTAEEAVASGMWTVAGANNKGPLGGTRVEIVSSGKRTQIVRKVKCNIPRCTNKAISRGLCQTCYRHLREAITQGKITEDELIREGILVPLPQQAVARWLVEYRKDFGKDKT
jgi:hypothetical protein